MEEIHLVIIWSKAHYKKEEILKDIKQKFDILEVYSIKWSKEKFSENLSRFYGENLPKNSGKEKHCGNGSFICIILKDNNPLYQNRTTSKGNRVVNTNLFDLKQVYRKWTDGGHKIHATDNIEETKVQLALLFGKDYYDYLNVDTLNIVNEINHPYDLVGANGWSSFEELFLILNLTSMYVILRNFDDLDAQLSSLHPDIDLLVENKSEVASILNAKPTTNKVYRVQYSVKVSDKNINFDLRYVGDKYYCDKFEFEILNQRKKYKFFYIPNKNMFFYSLIYHALIHKTYVSNDYIFTLKNLSSEVFAKPLEMNQLIDSKMFDILLDYMNTNNYTIVEPIDLTVTFNKNIIYKRIFIPITKGRLVIEVYFSFRSMVKNILLKRLKKVFK